MADSGEHLHNFGERGRFYEQVVFLSAGEVALELPLVAVDSLALHAEDLHYVHPVPFRLPALLLLLQLQLQLPRRLELHALLEVLQSCLLRVLEASVVWVGLCSLGFQKFLEGFHDLCLVFDRMGQEFLLIEEADAS